MDYSTNDNPAQLESDESKNVNNFASPGHHLITLENPFEHEHTDFLYEIQAVGYNQDILEFVNFNQNDNDLRMMNSNQETYNVYLPSNENNNQNKSAASPSLFSENNSADKTPSSNPIFPFAKFVDETELSDEENNSGQHASPLKNANFNGNIIFTSEAETDLFNIDNEEPITEIKTVNLNRENEVPSDESETYNSDKENEVPFKKSVDDRDPLVPKSSTNNLNYKFVSMIKRIKTYSETMNQLAIQCEDFLLGGGFVIKHPSQKAIYTYKFLSSSALPNSGNLITILNAHKINKSEIIADKKKILLEMPEGRQAQMKKFDKRVASLYRRASIGATYLETEWVVYFIVEDDVGEPEVRYFEFGDQVQLDNIVIAVPNHIKVEKLIVKKYDSSENNIVPSEANGEDDNSNVETENTEPIMNDFGMGLFEMPDAYDTPLLSPSKNMPTLGDQIHATPRYRGGRGSRGRRGTNKDNLRSTRARGISRGGRGSSGQRIRGGEPRSRGLRTRGGGRGSRGLRTRGGGRGSRGPRIRGGGRGPRTRGSGRGQGARGGGMELSMSGDTLRQESSGARRESSGTGELDNRAGVFNNEVGVFNNGAVEFNNGAGGFNNGAGEFNNGAGEFNNGAGEFNNGAGEFNKVAREFNNGAGKFNNKVGELNSGGRGKHHYDQEGNGEFNKAAGEFKNGAGEFNKEAGEFNKEAGEFNNGAVELNSEDREERHNDQGGCEELGEV